MIEEFISDSNKTSLVVHSKAVSIIAVMMAERLGLNDNLKSSIRIAALLHDIGKCYSEYQNYRNSNIVSEEFKANGLPLLHHEISWAILKKILPTSEAKSQILYAIYWHHSKEISTNKKEYATAIIDILSDENIQSVLDLYNYLMSDNKTIIDAKVQLNDDSYPNYYANKNDRQNFINMAILSCVISADRRVSKVKNQERILTDKAFCNSIIDELTFSDKKVYKIPHYYDLDRFNYQMECIKDIGENQTTILKAPSGFGKTITGIISWIVNGKENKKLIWVCPRNVIAQTIYTNVTDELKALSIEAKVELFLTGKVQERNYEASEHDEGFTADIIIINIDNFLAPNLNNYARCRMYSIMSNYVIFDEFHELIAKEAYFACFVNIMNARHKLTNSQTLLMSATPSIMHKLWDGEKKTKILPENNNHYNAPHNKKFKFNCIKGLDNIQAENNHLLIVNSITNAQELCKTKEFPIIAHSKYMPEHRKDIIENIFDRFGKGEDKPAENKLGTVSAPLIQAAMNISYLTVSESVKSPEDTFQRLGRCNRFGQYELATFNLCIDIDNKHYEKRETGAIKTTYNETLTDLWKKYIRKNINTDLTYTLDELYVHYNKHNQESEKEILKYINDTYSNSLSNMSKLYPRKHLLKKDIKKDNNHSNEKQGPTGFRDNGVNKIYCIYPIYNTNLYTDVFSVDDNGPDVDKGDDSTQRNQLNAIKSLLSDERFEYNQYRLYKNGNKFTTKKLLDMAKNDKTPYICFHKTYHPELGLVINSLLKGLK